MNWEREYYLQDDCVGMVQLYSILITGYGCMIGWVVPDEENPGVWIYEESSWIEEALQELRDLQFREMEKLEKKMTRIDQDFNEVSKSCPKEFRRNIVGECRGFAMHFYTAGLNARDENK